MRLTKKLGKETKSKLVLAIIIFFLGLIFSFYFSSLLNEALSGKLPSFRISIWSNLKSIFVDSKHRMLFLCFILIDFALSVLYFATNNKPYQSQLIEITPDIKIPAPAGQGQHGTSWFLDESEKDKSFEVLIINKNNTLIRNLIKEGDADYKRIEETSKKKKTGDKEKTPKKSPIKDSSESSKDRKDNVERKIDNLQTKIDAKVEFLKLIKSKIVNKIKPNISKKQIEETAKTEDLVEISETEETDDLQLFNQGGIVLGRDIKSKKNEKIYCISEDTHALGIGATRSGKSRTLVLQTICTLGLAGENIIASDPKGELWAYTSKMLENLGYTVIAIDFENPKKSHGYNFLQSIIDKVDENDIPTATKLAWTLTSILVGEPDGEKIWTNGECSIIASSIMSVVYDNRSGANRVFQNMTNVYYFIAKMCTTVDGKLPLLKYMTSLPDTHPAKGLISISDVAPSKTRGSFYTSALTTLRLFTDPLVYQMTNFNSYKISDIGDKKMAVFIILPDEESIYYQIASLFVAQHYNSLVKVAKAHGGRIPRRLNFVLDEFGNFSKIPDFQNKLTVGGGRGMKFFLFVQAFAQIEEKYGKEVSIIIKGNCETWIYLQADDNETRKEISDKLGNYTTSTYSLSSSNGKYTTPSSSQSSNLVQRNLLAPEEIMKIRRPYNLVTSRVDPVVFYSPDLSEWIFNKILSLGDKEHNLLVMMYRDKQRVERPFSMDDIKLWGIWNNISAINEINNISGKSENQEVLNTPKQGSSKPVKNYFRSSFYRK